MTQSVKQEMPEGYKRTEIGVIPEDWALVTYDEAFKFLRTASYSRDQLGLGTTIYIHYGDVHTKWNHFVDLNEDLPTIEDEKVNSYSLVEDGDLIVSDASEDYEGVCKSVEVRNKNSMKAISGLHTFLLRDKGNYFADGFKGYIHCNSLVKANMDKLATGLKVYGVSKSNLKLIKIPQPPLPEQNAIISVLSDIDRLITKQEKLIRKKKNIKQGTMKELLTGKRRLPGFSGDWKSEKLGKMATIYRGASPRPIADPKWFNDQSDVGWVRISDVTDSKKYLYGTTQKLSDEGIVNSRRVDKDNLIMSICATIGRPIITKLDVCIHDGFVVFDKLQNNLDFIYYFLTYIEDKWSRHGQTGSQMNLNTTIIQSETCFLPEDKIEQAAIANTLSDIDSEISKLELQLEKYKNIKQGMMQNLLTGKIRLNKKLWTNNQ